MPKPGSIPGHGVGRRAGAFSADRVAWSDGRQPRKFVLRASVCGTSNSGCVAAAILPFLLRGPGVASLPFVAAAVQIGDAFPGALRSHVKMAVAASIAAVFHIACDATLF
jgi:hypothetical protein